MMMIYLYAINLLLCVARVKSRAPALGEIGRARAIMHESIEEIVPGSENKAAGEEFKEAMDGKLDLLSESVKELSADGDTEKIAAAGAAATGVVTFFEKVIKGDLKDGKDWAAEVLTLAEAFGDVGGAFAPPPLGQAITTGFGIVNTFMSVAGLTPKVPSQAEIMEELLDKQTKKIEKMFDELFNKMWKNTVMDGSAGVLAILKTPAAMFAIYLNKNTISKENRKDLYKSVDDAQIHMTKHLSKLRQEMKNYCAVMKTADDENKCLILIESYSEILNMYTDLLSLAMELANKKNNKKNKKKTINCEEDRTKDKNRGARKDKLCWYYNVKKVQIGFAKETFEKIILRKNERQNKTSKTCIKTKLLSLGKFNYTKYALRLTNIKLTLTESEKSGEDIVCPSSNTKLMLVGGDPKSNIQLLSPFKDCKGKIKNLPDSHAFFRTGAAFYTTPSGDERVMVCGGQASGDWGKYLETTKTFNRVKCHSINSAEGANWLREANLAQEAGKVGHVGKDWGVTKPSMVFDKYNLHLFGGYTLDDWEKYNLMIFSFSSRPEIPDPTNEDKTPHAWEQIWKMDSEIGNYTWDLKSPNFVGDTESEVAYRLRAFRGARCTVFHDDQFYSQGLNWTKKEISGPAQFTIKANYNPKADVEYSEPIKACLWGHNGKSYHGKSLEECKLKCRFEKTFDCKSIEYQKEGNKCFLSKETKETQPNSVQEPCTGKWADMDYLERKGGRKQEYTPAIAGCIWNLNDEFFKRVPSLQDCQKECTARSWCRSMDYIVDKKECALSRETKSSAPDNWRGKGDCWNWMNPRHYLSSVYSAKVIVVDPDSTLTTISRWNDLPTEEYPYTLVHSCTVGVIFGQTSFITSGHKGVYYFPIPYNPAENPEHNSHKWQHLTKPPPEDCKAGLGWADGKLVCVPVTTRDKTKGGWSKKFYYFEEHEEAGGKWITRNDNFDVPTDALNAYVTVPGSFDKCKKDTK